MKKRIYLYEDGILKRQDNSLVYYYIDKKDYLPIYQIESIDVFGHISLNKEVLKLLALNNISIFFFDFVGNYIGSFHSKERKIGDYLIKQVECYKDIEKHFAISKEIILSSVDNMLSLMKYYKKKGEDLIELISLLEEVKEKINVLPITKKDNLLIYEAQAKQLYYSSFDKIIKNKDFKFNERSTRPPRNEINAIMSYGYALLYSIFENIIYRSNLEISLPFIHGITRSPCGLQYDLSDIYKPIIIDRIILRLINKKQLQLTHFEEKHNGVYLTKDGARLFIQEFEDMLNSTIKISSNRSYSYRSLLTKEVYVLSKSIFEDKTYKAYRMSW